MPCNVSIGEANDDHVEVDPQERLEGHGWLHMAAAAKMDITPHAPQPGYHAAYMLHFASVTANLGRFQEYPAARFEQPSWYGPQVQVRNGAVRVPNGPGMGITIDGKFLERAESLGRR